jgi:hypothetical protein
MMKKMIKKEKLNMSIIHNNFKTKKNEGNLVGEEE